MRCWIDFNCINVLFASSFYISCFDKFCYLETFPSFLLLFTLHYTSRRSFMNPNPRPSSYVHYPGNKFTVFCDFVLHHRGKNRRSGLTVLTFSGTFRDLKKDFVSQRSVRFLSNVDKYNTSFCIKSLEDWILFNRVIHMMFL